MSNFTYKGYCLSRSRSGKLQENFSVDSSTVGVRYASTTTVSGNPTWKKEEQFWNSWADVKF